MKLLFTLLLFLLVPSDNLKIECIELYARDNAREHRTDRYEMVRYDVERERHMNMNDSLNMRRVISFFIRILFYIYNCWLILIINWLGWSVSFSVDDQYVVDVSNEFDDGSN